MPKFGRFFDIHAPPWGNLMPDHSEPPIQKKLIGLLCDGAVFTGLNSIAIGCPAGRTCHHRQHKNHACRHMFGGFGLGVSTFMNNNLLIMIV